MKAKDSNQNLISFLNHYEHKKTLELKHTITFYYGSQQTLAFQGHVLSPQVWNIA
jgi:hypothetical protein